MTLESNRTSRFKSNLEASQVPNCRGSYRSGKTGKSEFEWSGKGQGKIFFLEKSGKMKNWCRQMSDFLAKMHQIRFPLELHLLTWQRTVTHWGSLQRSPTAGGAYSTPPPLGELTVLPHRWGSLQHSPRPP